MFCDLLCIKIASHICLDLLMIGYDVLCIGFSCITFEAALRVIIKLPIDPISAKLCNDASFRINMDTKRKHI